MSRYFGKSWYLGIFPAVAGFAAGAALEGDYSWVFPAIKAAGGLEGKRLMWLACQSALLDGMLWLWASVWGNGRGGRIMAHSAVWLKMVMMGLCCRGLVYPQITFIGLLLCVMTAAGGSAVCASLMIPGEASGDAKRLKLYLWLTGVMIEGVLITSAAKSVFLLS